MNGDVSQLEGKRTHLTRKEAAEYLRITQNSKHIPFYKFGSRMFYVKEELDELIRRNRRGE
jgi:hypothetical protein